MSASDKVPLQEGGPDGGLVVGFYCNMAENAERVRTFQVLEEAKTAAKFELDRLGYAAAEGVSAVLGGEDILVYPTGGNTGKETGGIVYKYRFRMRGIVFMVHANPKGDIFPVRVRYGAEAVMGQNVYDLHRNFVLPFLTKIGFPVIDEILSTCDLQVLMDVELLFFLQCIMGGQAVSTFRKCAYHGRLVVKGMKVFTITLGSRKSVELCMYDKRRELRDHFGIVKEQLFMEHCVGEEWYNSDRPITRIEFRLSRDALKGFGVRTMEDLRQRERHIVDILTSDCFRILETKKVRGHENNAKLHPIWEEVRSKFFAYFTGAEVPAEQVQRKANKMSVSAPNVKHLSLVSLGCLAKIFAYQNGKQSDGDSVQKCGENWIGMYRGKLCEKINAFSDYIRLATGVELSREEYECDAGNAAHGMVRPEQILEERGGMREWKLENM